MDGNRRWARNRGFPSELGYAEGVKAIDRVIDYSKDFGIEFLSIYAFSTENWKRSSYEVGYLMSLLKRKLIQSIKEKGRNVRINIIGDRSHFSKKMLDLFDEIETVTYYNNELTLNVAVNYGSKNEIVNSAKNIVKRCIDGDLDLDDIDENLLKKNLYTKDQPDIDLLIRTGGEFRLSNFMLWQIAYAEIFYTDVLWPDFSLDDYKKAINEYNLRDRRFGK